MGFAPRILLWKGCVNITTDDFLPRNLELKHNSRELRTNATKEENHLWFDFLRSCNPRFTRQRVIGNYIVDFYCHYHSLVIELDGGQHYEPDVMDYDAKRTAYLNALALRVLRFTNHDIDRNFEAVGAAHWAARLWKHL